MPSEDVVKQHIATAVRKADLNAVSAKQIRRAVEKQLNLEHDELGSGKWKAIVKSVIDETIAEIGSGEPITQEQPVEEESEDEFMRMTPLKAKLKEF